MGKRKVKKQHLYICLSVLLVVVLAIGAILIFSGNNEPKNISVSIGDATALAGDTVKALLVKIAERWSANEQLVISTSEAEQLKDYFAKNAKALLDKGVTIEQVNGKKAQFSIAPADGSYKVNFGEGEFEAFFKAFLRPQMVELLFS